MKGFLDISRPEDGEWFALPVPGMEADERPEFLVRAVPASRRRELYYRRFGTRQRVGTGRRGRVVRKEDNDRWDAFTVDIAVEALGDSRNGFALMLPEPVVAKLSQHMEAKPGEWICFDGKWTEPVKRIVLELLADVRPSVVRWIFDHSQQIATLEEEDEEELGKT